MWILLGLVSLWERFLFLVVFLNIMRPFRWSISTESVDFFFVSEKCDTPSDRWILVLYKKKVHSSDRLCAQWQQITTLYSSKAQSIDGFYQVLLLHLKAREALHKWSTEEDSLVISWVSYYIIWLEAYGKLLTNGCELPFCMGLPATLYCHISIHLAFKISLKFHFFYSY